MILRRRFLLIGIALLLLIPAGLAQDAPENADAPWWADTVWYQIFVRSFYDSDGDGIGDFQGIIEKLDYLNDGDPNTTDDLGITGIWLMPISPSPSYHGYDVTDYYDVNPDYGTMDDFRELLAEAEARGIRIIIDLVMNHSSSQHPWFIESMQPGSAYDDWYVWSDDDPGYRGPDGQPVWHQRGGDGRYYYGVFWSEMPDLNHENPAVTDEMFDIFDFWLGDVGVHGFRVDAVKHLIEEGERQENVPANRSYMALFNEYAARVADDVDPLIIGEIWSPTRAIVPYIEAGSVDLAFEFDLAEAIFSSVRGGSTRAIERAFTRGLDDYPPGQYASFLTNHDQNRIMSLLEGEVGRAKTAASILLTTPGVPFIYYGEEIGMLGTKPDPRIRTPMQWDDTPVTAGFTTADQPYEPLAEPLEDQDGLTSVAEQDADPDSLLNHYRALIHMRNATPALQTGTMQVIEDAARGVFAYLRTTGDDTLLIMINLDDDPVEGGVTLALDEGPLTSLTGYEVLYGPDVDFALPETNAAGGFAETIVLPEMGPFETLILRLN